jgi:hypothetical protein
MTGPSDSTMSSTGFVVIREGSGFAIRWSARGVSVLGERLSCCDQDGIARRLRGPSTWDDLLARPAGALGPLTAVRPQLEAEFTALVP